MLVASAAVLSCEMLFASAASSSVYLRIKPNTMNLALLPSV